MMATFKWSPVHTEMRFCLEQNDCFGHWMVVYDTKEPNQYPVEEMRSGDEEKQTDDETFKWRGCQTKLNVDFCDECVFCVCVFK